MMRSVSSGASCACDYFEPVTSDASLMVHLKDGTIIPLPDSCLSCGFVSGTTAGFIRNDDLKRLSLKLRTGVERKPAAPYALPAWNDPVLGTPPNSNGDLFQGWKKLETGRRRGNLYAILKIGRDQKIATSQLPGLPRVSFDSRAINHIVDSEDGTGDHVLFAPLLPKTLNEPDSVWNGEYQGKPEQLLYLKRYRYGSAVASHLAVVDLRGEFVRTAYRISRSNPETYRFGILQYSAWALK